MPLFKFKVADKSGRLQEMLFEGETQEEATRRIGARGFVPIQFLGQSDSISGSRFAFWSNRIDIADFTDRLVPLLQANIPLERALKIVEETSESDAEKDLSSGLRSGLHEGRRFSQLVADRGQVFPRMYASIIEAGEESGALPQIMAQMREFLITTREMQGFIISASIYPVFVMIVCFGVISILLGVVVPNFTKVILSSGKDPSFTTGMLIAVSDLFKNFWWVSFLVIGALAFLVVQIRRNSVMREKWDDFVLRVPLIRKLVILANIGRMVRTMAILMRSGVHLLDTVRISAKVMSNQTLQNSISGLATELRRGERLSVGLGRSPYIPPLVTRMLAVGEETGETDIMLERVADRYDNELKTILKRAMAWFEPLIIIVLGGVVGAVVLLLFLAIMDMQKSFH